MALIHTPAGPLILAVPNHLPAPHVLTRRQRGQWGASSRSSQLVAAAAGAARTAAAATRAGALAAPAAVVDRWTAAPQRGGAPLLRAERPTFPRTWCGGLRLAVVDGAVVLPALRHFLTVSTLSSGCPHNPCPLWPATLALPPRATPLRALPHPAPAHHGRL
jgi:hypothetical protein